MTLTPMLLVDDISAASSWLQHVFELKSMHGGNEFEMLADETGAIILWLHANDTDHEHPQTSKVNMGGVGDGVTLYIQVKDIEATLARAKEKGGEVLEDLHFNALAHFREFSIAGPQGYCFAAHTAFAGNSDA